MGVLEMKDDELEALLVRLVEAIERIAASLEAGDD
jgi:hypothetical protein